MFKNVNTSHTHLTCTVTHDCSEGLQEASWTRLKSWRRVGWGRGVRKHRRPQELKWGCGIGGAWRSSRPRETAEGLWPWFLDCSTYLFYFYCGIFFFFFCVKLSTIYNRSTSSGFFFSPGIKSQQYLRGEDLAQEEAGPQAASGGGSGVEKGRLKSFLHLRPWLCDSSRPHGLQPTRLLLPWDFPGESTGVGCHCLLRLLWYLLFVHFTTVIQTK